MAIKISDVAQTAQIGSLKASRAINATHDLTDANRLKATNPLAAGLNALSWVGDRQDDLDRAVGIPGTNINVYNARHSIIDPLTNAANQIHPGLGVATNVGLEMILPDSTLYMGKVFKGAGKLGKSLRIGQRISESGVAARARGLKQLVSTGSVTDVGPGIRTGAQSAVKTGPLRTFSNNASTMRRQVDDMLRESYKNIKDPLWKTVGYNIVGNPSKSMYEILKLSPHHAGMDLAFARKTLNWSDLDEVLGHLKNYDIYPGSHPRNFIGLYHDNSKLYKDSFRFQLAKKVKKAGTNESKWDAEEWGKFLKDFKFDDIDAAELRGLDGEAAMKKIAELSQSKKYGRNWPDALKGTNYKNLGEIDIQIPEVMIGRDHQDFVHGIADNLPKRKQIEAWVENGDWFKKSAKERAFLIAESSNEYQNVAFNVAAARLKKIEAHMRENNFIDLVTKKVPSEGAEYDWGSVVQFMTEDPARAANLGWFDAAKAKTPYDAVGISAKNIVKPPSEKVMKRLRDIFLLHEIPKTHAAVNAARNAKVKLSKP